MIDLHCHILPEMDDGSKSMEESREMLAIAAAEVIRVIAATQHFIEDQTSIDAYLKRLEDGIKRLQPYADEPDKGIRIVKGAEVYISPEISRLDGVEKLCLAGSRYLLMELPMRDIPQYTEDVIYNLRLKGIQPIIAHPERNHRIQDDPNLFLPLIELGAMGQVNAGSINGFFGDRARKCARILFDHKMAHLVGTDAHSSGRRAPRIREASEKLRKWIGAETADVVLNNTPQAILNNVFLEVDPPIRYRQRLFHFLFF